MTRWIGTGLACMACSLSGAALGSKAGQFSLPPYVHLTYAKLNDGFVCPELRPTNAARQADVDAFDKAMIAVLPAVTEDQLAHMREGMLRQHRCG